MQSVQTAVRVVHAVAASVTAAVGVQSLLPTPTAYIRGEAGADVKDPKAEIKFGNIGFGPMFIETIYFTAEKTGCDRKQFRKISEILPNAGDWNIGAESVLSERLDPPRGFARDAIIPICTIRPKESSTEPEWFHKLTNQIRDDKVTVVVRYRLFEVFPFSTFTREKRIPLW